MRSIVSLLCLLALALPVALAHGGDADGEIGEQVFHGTGTVLPGGFAEVDFETEENATVAWSVRSSHDVTVNIHQHQHVKTETYARHNDTQEASETFVAPDAGTFSLMVVGTSPEDAEVEVELDGTFGVVGMTGLTVEEESPVPAMPLLVLAVFAAAVAFRRRL